MSFMPCKVCGARLPCRYWSVAPAAGAAPVDTLLCPECEEIYRIECWRAYHEPGVMACTLSDLAERRRRKLAKRLWRAAAGEAPNP